jgi:Lsr2
MARLFDPSSGECRLVDDLDFSEAASMAGFILDGVHYELALSADNLAKLRSRLRRYIAVSHVVGRDAIPRT